MRDRLVELLNQRAELCLVDNCRKDCEWYRKGDRCMNHAMADHLIANGVIVPPCKVGDTVYYINLYNHIMLYKDRVYEASVSRIVVTKSGVSVLIIIHGGHAANEIPYVEFGENVFLTREEAEQALKGSASDA